MKFEGEPVDGMRVTIRQFKGDTDTPMTVDEVIELRVMAKVTNISHEINEKDHGFYRNHILKVIDVEVEGG